MYRCDCGKEFEKSQSYNAHQGRCPINRKNKDRVVVDTLNEDGPWNKGLSSEDPRIKDLSKKISSSLKGKSHPQSDITKLKISRSMKLVGGEDIGKDQGEERKVGIKDTGVIVVGN